MPSYRYFDYQLLSDREFPELSPSADSSHLIRLVEVPMSQMGLSDQAIELHRWEESDMFCRVEGARYQLVFPDLLTVTINHSEPLIHYALERDIPDTMLRHLLLDQALPRYLSHCGDLILHASAVTKNHQTIAFVGASGLGKSTFAGAFLREGWEILSDDCLKVQSGAAHVGAICGGYAGLRLYADSATSLWPSENIGEQMRDESEKYRYRMDSKRYEPAALSLIVILSEEDESVVEPQLTPLSGATALFALLQETFTLDPSDMDKAIHRVEMLSLLLEKTPLVLSLACPRDYQSLPSVLALLQAAEPFSENQIQI